MIIIIMIIMIIIIMIIIIMIIINVIHNAAVSVLKRVPSTCNETALSFFVFVFSENIQ